MKAQKVGFFEDEDMEAGTLKSTIGSILIAFIYEYTKGY
jgi:hypothetical protein